MNSSNGREKPQNAAGGHRDPLDPLPPEILTLKHFPGGQAGVRATRRASSNQCIRRAQGLPCLPRSAFPRQSRQHASAPRRRKPQAARRHDAATTLPAHRQTVTLAPFPGAAFIVVRSIQSQASREAVRSGA